MASSDYLGKCTFEGCDRPIYHKTWQLCNAHKTQKYLGKELRPVTRKLSRPPWGTKICKVPSCDLTVIAKEYCLGHYRQHRNDPDLVGAAALRPKESRSYRDEMGRKLCYKCGEWKNVTEFEKIKSAQDGLRGNCTQCRTLESRRSHLLRSYNLTLEQYDNLLAAQNGLCAICGRKPLNDKWAVDHDHHCCPQEKTCGKCVRAILCHSCNLRLGVIENKSFTEAANAYLAKYQCQEE